ncbi:MAG: group III truncated hemoglobin [Acidobacteriaceae bacterium]
MFGWIFHYHANMAGTLNEESIATLVDTFYGRVRKDELLSPVFDGVIGDHWPEHLAKMKDFWSSIMLSTGRYKGNPLMAHLPIPQMDSEHLERWISLWEMTTSEIFEPDLAEAFLGKALMIGDRLVSVSTQVREAQLAAMLTASGD